MDGTLKLYNTIEEFQSMDKSEILSQCSTKLIYAMSFKEFKSLNFFYLALYADLKRHRFYYWFCFPALVANEPMQLNTCMSLDEMFNSSHILQLQQLQPLGSLGPIFVIEKNDKILEFRQLNECMNSLENLGNGSLLIGFLDPSTRHQIPGWPLRNFLYLLSRANVPRVHVVCLRRALNASRDVSKSFVLVIDIPACAKETPRCVGWERHPTGQFAPRTVDLSSSMDPYKLAEQAVDLNLKLMKWRAMPDIPLDKISSQKCLLFGAGTLGCYVARTLVAWGIRHITFVDNGKVSFSNPVRQPLYHFDDCLHGGKDKAIAAANHLKLIFPGVHAQGLNLLIPMPGHHFEENQESMNLLKQLQDLVSSHDVLFLLTDSREARWLPTLLGAAMNKIVMNAALGFDSFLVMRHGSLLSKVNRLGCYFCNDVVVPTDSLKHRTLDQQCTVTRPGLSLMASSLVVELLIALINHPLGVQAQADDAKTPSESIENPFGLVPHQIRGFLTHFSNLIVKGNAFDKCTACSQRVIDQYNQLGNSFLFKAINEPKSLESLLGLSELYASTKDVDIEWDE